MTISIANPLYDAVFKYLVDDERIARTLLSALLKKEVVEVEMRKHEYPNGQRDRISMFRVDFAARVREADGTLRLTLIELQKTWVETETLRFRQYLGAQYFDPGNMVGESRLDDHALPMVAVYLLGHRVGDIKEPVLYVSHHAYDYDGNPVTEGMPDPFVESLTHDSIIVQLPLLRKQLRTRLDRVLSIFDQSRRNQIDQHVLNIDPSAYEGDADLAAIMHRLVLAAASPEMRLDMNVEDEYFAALENRDTEIMEKDKLIAEKEGVIAEKEGVIAEKEGVIAEKDKLIAGQEAAMRNMAKAMLDSGMQPELVAKAMGKSVEEIRSL